jgi:hypothetical protein
VKFIVNGVKYEFDDEKVTFAEARAIQKAVGKTMGEIQKDPGDVTAMQASVWIAMKRMDPSLRFADLDDMSVGDIEWMKDEDAPVEEPDAAGDPLVLDDVLPEDSMPSE